MAKDDVVLAPDEVALVTVSGMKDLLMVIPDHVDGLDKAPTAVEFLAACALKWRTDPTFVRNMIAEFWAVEAKRRMH